MQGRTVRLAETEHTVAGPTLSKRHQVLLGFGVGAGLLIPCFWQPHIQAGDLASHVYNAWLARQIARGAIQGLSLAHPSTNVLADWVLEFLLGVVGPAWAARLVAAAAVQIFFWGAFRFVAAATGRNPWLVAPSLAMLAYGLIFHFGFLNFYLSTGFSLWIMSLLWSPSRRGILLSVPLALLAWLALALPLTWAVAALAYFHTARRVPERARVLLLVGGFAFLIVVQTGLMRLLSSQWSVDQFLNERGALGLTGALQFWLYGSKYSVIVAGMLLLWLLLFLERVDRGGLLSDPVVHLWFLNMAAFLLLPSGITLPQYQLGLLFIPERISLFIAILFCAMVGGALQGRGLTRLSTVLAAVFFTFVYVDVRAISGVDAEITSLLTGLPPGQRVVAALRDSGSGLNDVAHVLDWPCIGHCFDYANYEAPSAAFRVRVSGPNGVVAPTIAIAQEIEFGHHVVTPPEAPLYSVCPSSDPTRRLDLRKLKAGDVTCSFSLPITPQFSRAEQEAR